MNSVVQAYIIKDGVEKRIHCHNIVTTEGDLHYARKVAGEDTTIAFPELHLEFGAKPSGEFVDPEKFYNGTLVPVMTKPVSSTYLEPYTSFVYETTIANNIPSANHGAKIYQLAIVNGLAGSDKKAISVVNLPEPIVLSDLMYAVFKIKHTVHFPGTEDNIAYQSVLIHEDKSLFLDLPDLNRKEINTYYIENLTTKMTKVTPYTFFKNLTLLERNKVHVTVYKSKCQELDKFICVPYEHNFLGCADVDNIYAQYTTDSIEQVATVPYNAFVSYHTFIVPISSGLWRFSYKGGFLIEVFVNGQRALVANTQAEGIYEDVGYVYLEAGVQYSLVVNHAQVIGKENFQLLIAPPKWTNLQTVGLPFTPRGLLGFIDYYNDTDTSISTIAKNNFSVIQYGVVENFEDSRKYSLCYLPKSNRHLLRINYPTNDNSLLPITVNSGFLLEKELSIIKVNYLDIYYRSALKLTDGGVSFPTVHIYDILYDPYSNFVCYLHNTRLLNIYYDPKLLDNGWVSICPHVTWRDIKTDLAGVCSEGTHYNSIDQNVYSSGFCVNKLSHYVDPNTDYIHMIPAGGGPKDGAIVGSRPMCLRIPHTHIYKLKLKGSPVCISGANTHIYKIDSEDSKVICWKRSVHIYNIETDPIISCAEALLHINNVDGTIMYCNRANTLLKGIFYKTNYHTWCSGFLNIYDIKKNSITLKVCFWTTIHSIDQLYNTEGKEFCARGTTEPTVNYDIALSKNFCATLKLPPPPGEG